MKELELLLREKGIEARKGRKLYLEMIPHITTAILELGKKTFTTGEITNYFGSKTPSKDTDWSAPNDFSVWWAVSACIETFSVGKNPKFERVSNNTPPEYVLL